MKAKWPVTVKWNRLLLISTSRFNLVTAMYMFQVSVFCFSGNFLLWLLTCRSICTLYFLRFKNVLERWQHHNVHPGQHALENRKLEKQSFSSSVSQAEFLMYLKMTKQTLKAKNPSPMASPDVFGSKNYSWRMQSVLWPENTSFSYQDFTLPFKQTYSVFLFSKHT